MAVKISGMFGNGKTYFAGSPVVIDISGLQWSEDGETPSSPFTVVRIEVVYKDKTVGDFYADTGGQTSISFDISSALRAIWADYDFNAEVSAAQQPRGAQRESRPYSLVVHTEYIDSQSGKPVTTDSPVIDGGQCAIGRLTEWERSIIGEKEDGSVAHDGWQKNLRNGNASTKPSGAPERVGIDSITSWVTVHDEGTQSVFFPASAGKGTPDSETVHAPLVLRDSIPYTDFIFVNRRGAVETCSAQALEDMSISVETQQYARVERPSFRPSRSLMAISRGGRRSWSMSSGSQTREWAEWWTDEFLMARRWWMRYNGAFVPVIVEPGGKSTRIYDRSKQQMPHVDFTVTLALEG